MLLGVNGFQEFGFTIREKEKGKKRKNVGKEKRGKKEDCRKREKGKKRKNVGKGKRGKKGGRR